MKIKYLNFFKDDPRFSGTSIPVIIRSDGVKYLCVRIIDQRVLSKFEDKLSDEARDFGLLESYDVSLHFLYLNKFCFMIYDE